MLVVLDTNVLVSALLSRNGPPATLLAMVLTGALVPCHDHRILHEYRDVLSRPKFAISIAEVDALMGWFEDHGRPVGPTTPTDVPFTDETDKKFYEVAMSCGAVLVTGDLRHFPRDDRIMSVSEFLRTLGP